MASLYPSLEDMKVDHMAQAQVGQHQQQYQPIAQAAPTPPAYGDVAMPNSQLYPSLDKYMGLHDQELTELARTHMPEQKIVPYQSTSRSMVAPITGNNNMGLMRAEVQAGVRQVVACKDQAGKLGIRVQHVSNGVFVSLVTTGSPAALAGLRFGDQILQINGRTVAGLDRQKVMKLISNAAPNQIDLAIRDRPFERTITLQKDSSGHVGFVFKDGKITSLVKDSSAARNGLLTEHNILEVNGQNVVGLKDKETSQILTASDTTVTLTIIPTFIYKHMMNCMKDSLVRKEMDHSIPDV